MLHLSHEIHTVGIAVPAIDDHRHIDIENIAVA
jgi:hypothetical protein